MNYNVRVSILPSIRLLSTFIRFSFNLPLRKLNNKPFKNSSRTICHFDYQVFSGSYTLVQW